MKTTFAYFRTLIFTLLAGCLIGSITACGGTSPTIFQAETVATAPPSPSAAQDSLHVWIATNKSTTEIQALLEQICAENGLEVEFNAANLDLVLPALRDTQSPRSHPAFHEYTCGIFRQLRFTSGSYNNY